MAMQAAGLFQFSLYGEFEPIATAGSGTEGDYRTVWMKIGSLL